jgi:ligand-binding sensor domain-containing protein
MFSFKNILLLSSIVILMIFSIGCNKAPIPTAQERDLPWKIFNKSNSLLVDNKINSIYIDASGGKWFSTNNGASRLLSETWENVTYQLEYNTAKGRSRAVNAIAVGKDGSIWYGLAGGGIRRRMVGQSNIWKEYRTPNLTSDMIYSMKTDNAGDIWIGTASGGSRCVPAPNIQSEDRWYQYNSENSLIPDEPIQSIGISPHDGTIWFGTYSLGVVTYDVDIDWNYFAPNDLPLPVLSIGYTYGKYVWFGTYGDWAYQFNSQTSEWKQFADSAKGGGLPNFIVNAVVHDQNANIWFGTNNGLAKYTGSKWQTWQVINSELPSDIITSLAVDRRGNLWIGTMNGVAEFNEAGILK